MVPLRGFEPIFFEIESPFLVQFWCSWDGNYGFIGRVGRKPPNFVEQMNVLNTIYTLKLDLLHRWNLVNFIRTFAPK